MRVLLTVTALVAVVGAASISLEDLEFHTWKLEFGKSYGSEQEESQRKMIWMDNRKLVLEHNILADQGIKSYRLGMNRFADMDNQEYQDMFKGCLTHFNITKAQGATTVLHKRGGTAPPSSVDWRTAGYVTPVKTQGGCESCWAFSATGALEGQMFKKTKKLIPLSEQQLVDCSQSFGNKGCKRGLAIQAFMYIMSVKGLQSEASYPYEAKDGTCRYNPQQVQATCTGYQMLPSGDENALQAAVATIGPISVSVDITQRSFQLYTSGVYDEPKCSSTSVNHAVLVVGYGTENKKDYWLVKNSWGDKWGAKGYIKMSRNKNNQCGITVRASYPKV